MTEIRQVALSLLLIFSFCFSVNAFAEEDDWGIEKETDQPELTASGDEEADVDKEDTGKSDSGGSFFNKLMEAAGGALGSKVEEEIDRLSGNYDGKITDIVLIERLGNKLVFDAHYEGIKRSDGVSISKEVMYQGTVLSGFKSTPTSVSGKGGKVRLAIKFKGGEEDDGWGVEGEDDVGDEVYSDQIRLSLVREKNPDKPFGALAFDLDKLWTDSDEPDQPFDDEAMELEEDSGKDGTIKPMPGVFVKPGVVIKPAPLKSSNLKPVVAKPVLVKPKGILVVVNNNYDIYSNVEKLKWSTGSESDEKVGIGARVRNNIRKIEKAKLSTGNNATKLIYTHPAPNRDGFAEGKLSNIKLVKKTHFKSAVGFIGNSQKSDGAIFSVYLIDSNGKRVSRKFRKRVNPNKYEYIDFDLSSYKGKVVTIVMRVDGGANSSHDSSVWIAPRLEVVE